MTARPNREDEESSKQSWQESIQEFLLSISPELYIALLRLVLAISLLLAIQGSFGPPVGVAATRAVFTSYLFYTAVLAWVAARFAPLPEKANIGVNSVDLIFFVLLICISDGAADFYPISIFALLSASLQWGAKGIILAASILLGAQLLAETTRHWLEYPNLQSDVLWKATYLVVAGIAIGYFGLIRLRSPNRLTKLLAWPGENDPAPSDPVIVPLLQHAAEVLRSDRILVVWDNEQLLRRSVLWDRIAAKHSEFAEPATEPLVAATLSGAVFLTRGCQHRSVTSSKAEYYQDPGLTQDAKELLGERDFVSAPFGGGKCHGRVFIVEPHPLNEEMFPLAQAVASQIGGELEHFAKFKEASAVATMRERLRVARDLHDSILQDLTAAKLQFKVLSPTLSEEARARVDEITQLISTQQSRIRQLATPTVAKIRPSAESSFSDPVQQLIDRLSQQWRCQIHLSLDPPMMTAPWEIVNQTCLMISEAVANSVRHGEASEVSVEIRFSVSDWLQLIVADNGRGMGASAPASLVGRVSEMGGVCDWNSSPEGTKLLIELPCKRMSP
jgi:signal transduction histidine kinase